MTGNKQTKTGFTLTELIVVTAIFALIITTTIGLMIAATQTQRKGIALQNIQDNGRHLMAFMAKEIRVSEIISIDTPPLTGILVIDPPDIGTEADGTEITYTFTWPQITRRAYIPKKVEGEKKYVWDTTPLNSDQVNIDGTFIIDGRETGDNEQPRVTIIMKVESSGAQTKEKAEIELQTTISQRNLD
jgi:prepilin-type N-terminal cleavage/methylation domain-containing protein